jgi:hypothetical protein
MLCGPSLHVVKWIIDVRQSLVGARGRLMDLGRALDAQNCCTPALQLESRCSPFANSGTSNVGVNSPFFRLPYKPVGESDQRPNHRGQYPQLKIVQTEPVIVHYHFLTGKGFPGCLAAAEQRSPSTSVSCDDSCARLEALQLRPVAAGLTAACAPSVESVRSALSAQPRFSSLLILNCVVRRW